MWIIWEHYYKIMFEMIKDYKNRNQSHDLKSHIIILSVIEIICDHKLFLRVIVSSELRIIPGIWLLKLRHDQVNLQAKLLDIISLCCSKQLQVNVNFENSELKQTVARKNIDKCRIDRIIRWVIKLIRWSNWLLLRILLKVVADYLDRILVMKL